MSVEGLFFDNFEECLLLEPCSDPLPEDFLFFDFNSNLIDISAQGPAEDKKDEKKEKNEAELLFIGEKTNSTVSALSFSGLPLRRERHEEQQSSSGSETDGSSSSTAPQFDEKLPRPRDCLDRFFCDECSRGYRYKAHYDQHMRKHQTAKPYKCTISGCDKAYKAVGDLTRHVNSHTRKNTFTCRVCKAVFMHKHKLKLHMTKKHEISNFFRCRFCVKYYIEEEELQNHYKTRHRKL